VCEDLRIDNGFRADIIVDQGVLLEPQSVECLLPVNHTQMLAFLCDRVADEGWAASFRHVGDEGSDRGS
jgi:hypothetical protein